MSWEVLRKIVTSSGVFPPMAGAELTAASDVEGRPSRAPRPFLGSARPARSGVRHEEAATPDPEFDSRSSPASFEAFYLAHYDSLVRLAYVLTDSREIAEDLVQDCFVRLHGHYERVDTPDRYVRRAVVNACRSHFRRAGRERDRRPLLYVIDGAGDAGAAGGELTDVLLSLPYRQRAAVVLRFYSDLSEIEIAEILGCRPGTVGSLIHRGVERLRKALEE